MYIICNVIDMICVNTFYLKLPLSFKPTYHFIPISEANLLPICRTSLPLPDTHAHARIRTRTHTRTHAHTHTHLIHVNNVANLSINSGYVTAHTHENAVHVLKGLSYTITAVYLHSGQSAPGMRFAPHRGCALPVIGITTITYAMFLPA